MSQTPTKEAQDIARSARTLLRKAAGLAPEQAPALCELVARLNVVMKLGS